MEEPDRRNPGWGAGALDHFGEGIGKTDSTSSRAPQEIAVIRRSEREELHISLAEHAGYQFLKFRVFVFDDDSRIPILLGFTLPITKLDELTEALAKAKAEAVRLGSLPEPAGRGP